MMTREELVGLVKVLMECPEGTTEDEVYQLMKKFENNIPCPAGSDLIFYSDYETAEEIVDAALAYKPIILDDRSGT